MGIGVNLIGHGGFMGEELKVDFAEKGGWNSKIFWERGERGRLRVRKKRRKGQFAEARGRSKGGGIGTI